MSALEDLLTAYQEIETLNQAALQALQQGLDLSRLGPIFERKAALDASIAGQGSLDPSSDKAGLQQLIELQARCARSEAALIERLQPIVSSIATNGVKRTIDKGQGVGKRWDLSG